MKRGAPRNPWDIFLAIFAFLVMVLGAVVAVETLNAPWLYWAIPFAAIAATFLYFLIPTLRKKCSSIKLWINNAKQYDSVVEYARFENRRAWRVAGGWQAKFESYEEQLKEAKFDHPVQHKKGIELGRKLVIGELLAQRTQSTMKIEGVANEGGKLIIAAAVDGGSKVPIVGSTWFLKTRGFDLLHAVLEVVDFNGKHAKLSVVQVLNVDYMRHISTQAETHEFPSSLEITYRKFSAIEELGKDYSE